VLAARVLDLLGLSWGGTTPDGRVTVEPVYCLGLCAIGPAAMIDGAVRGRVRAEALVAEVAR
jgi:formate dehydrogenase subunit gamma